MNKFTIAESVGKEITNEDFPVLYKVHIGNKYYLHKGKKLSDSMKRLLDDVFRGVRGLQFPKEYANMVKYCKQYPALYKVMPEVVLNAEPAKVLAMEDKLYKSMAGDDACLNDPEILPYKPEWMLKEVFHKKCEGECVVSGIIEKKKIKFRFCPNCGKLNK